MSAKAALQASNPPSKLWRIDADSALYGLGQPVVFQGHYMLEVLRGAVAVGGVTLNASDRAYRLSCPIAPYYSIKMQYSLQSDDRLGLLGPEITQHFDGYPAVIKVTSQTLANWTGLAPPYRALGNVSVSKMSTSIADDELFNLFSSWKQIDGQIEAGDKVLMIGPKNSGKSTLSRYIYNQKLTQGGPVYYLELDPGQPEFCPPGTLSLHKLDAPVFAPPYAHSSFHCAVKTHSLGYPSPMETPGRYLSLCKELYDTWLSLIHESDNEKPAVLIVNTPGWTKGLGLELNIEVARIVEPSYLVYMGEDESYQELSDSLMGMPGALISVECFEPSQSKFSAAELRNLQTITYFHSEDPRHLTEQAPYQVPFNHNNTDGSAIAAVGITDSDGIDPNDYAMCLEGTIVAILLVDSTPEITLSRSGLPFISPDAAMNIHEVSQCVGYAVIQSINKEEGWVRLLTPLDPSTLDRTTVLLRGRLQIPLWEIWNQKTSQGPWFSNTSFGIGGVYTKFRRNIGRK